MPLSGVFTYSYCPTSSSSSSLSHLRLFLWWGPSDLGTKNVKNTIILYVQCGHLYLIHCTWPYEVRSQWSHKIHVPSEMERSALPNQLTISITHGIKSLDLKVYSLPVLYLIIFPLTLSLSLISFEIHVYVHMNECKWKLKNNILWHTKTTCTNQLYLGLSSLLLFSLLF